MIVIPRNRVAWGLIAFGLIMWNAGDAYYYLALVDDPSPPYPSLSDGLFLLFYASCLGGLLVMAGPVRRTASVSLSLVVSLLGLATIWSWLVFGGVLDTATGSTAAIATTAAYPLLDLFLLAAALVAVGVRGWHLDRAFALLIAGFTIMAVADLIYARQVAEGTYVDGAVLDSLWPTGALAIAFAGWLPATKARAVAGAGETLVPLLSIAAAAVATAMLIVDDVHAIKPITDALASVTLIAALVQLSLLYRDRDRSHAKAIAVESTRSASIDAALDCL